MRSVYEDNCGWVGKIVKSCQAQRLAEVRSWFGGQKSLEKEASRVTGQAAGSPLCCLHSLSYCFFFSLCKFVSFHLYLLAFSFLNAIFSLQIFVAFFPSQVQECSNCMKSQFVKRQRNNYQQLGIAEKMEQRIQLKSFRWLCSSDQGKHNPLFDKMTKYSPLFIQKISLTIS